MRKDKINVFDFYIFFLKHARFRKMVLLPSSGKTHERY